MDIYYCDNCGDVLLGSGQRSVSAQTLCNKCRGGAPAGESLESAKPSGADLDEYTMSSFVKEDDLFSSDTIARRKAQPAAKRKPSNLTIIDDEPAAKPVNQGPSGPQKDGLAVFDETLKMTGEFGADAPRPKLERPIGGSPAPAEPVAPRRASTALLTESPNAHADQAVSSTPHRPSPPARDGKWQLKCLACPAQLALKPVEKRSRLTCPKCKSSMVIHPAGYLELFQGSVAVRSSSPATRRVETPASEPADRPSKSEARGSAPSSAPSLEDSRVMAKSALDPAARSKPAAPRAAAAPASISDEFDPFGPPLAETPRPATDATPMAAAPSAPDVLAPSAQPTPHPKAQPTSIEHDPADDHRDPMAAAALEAAMRAPTRPLPSEDGPEVGTVPESLLPGAKRPKNTQRANSLTVILWLFLASCPVMAGLLLSTPHVPAQWQQLTAEFGDGARELAADLLTWLGRRAP